MEFEEVNENNCEITLNEVQSILRRYNVPDTVNNLNLYKRAFIHSSVVRRGEHTKSNERLEFLGDGVLELVTKYYLYRRFSHENEGFMTEKKIAIVKNESIGKIAEEMKLNKWLILSTHAEEKNIRNSLKKLGCLFEAFLGALFLDFNKVKIHDEDKWFEHVFVTGPGFQVAQKFIETVFEKHIDWTELLQTDDNYKNILQVKIQKQFKVTPHYLELSKTSDSDEYQMGVFLCVGQLPNIHDAFLDISNFKTFINIQEYIHMHGKIFLFLGKGVHKIKRKAEQIACEEALKVIA
jgi:dsRNA-specific ribonuclease